MTDMQHLETGDDYRASLQDGRAVFLDGRRVADVTANALLDVTVSLVARTYDEIRAGTRPALATAARTTEELARQMDSLTEVDQLSVITAGVLGLGGTAPRLDEGETPFGGRFKRFIDDARTSGNMVSVGRVEAGGEPVRIVSRDDAGITVRGAKAHVVGAPVAHHILVIPSEIGGKQPPESQIAFSVPVNAPGVKLLATTTAPRTEDTRHFPISRTRAMADAVVLFDNVVIPHENVYVDGSPDAAGVLAAALGVWERAVVVADRANESALILGLAQTIAEMNGVPNVGHIRHKMSQMAVFAAICRATWEAAVNHARPDEDGALHPDDLYVYSSMAYAGDLHNEMLSYLHDISGALLLTCPSVADYESEATHMYMEKYLRTMAGVTGEDRMKVFHLIRDLSADTYWGWKKIANQSIGGGFDAQQRAALDAFDLSHAKAQVVREAGLVR